jgi:hypothetical protein
LVDWNGVDAKAEGRETALTHKLKDWMASRAVGGRLSVLELHAERLARRCSPYRYREHTLSIRELSLASKSCRTGGSAAVPFCAFARLRQSSYSVVPANVSR